MGFAVEEGVVACCENKLIALGPFTTLYENHTLNTVGKVVRLRRNAIIWLGGETEQQIMTSDQFVN